VIYLIPTPIGNLEDITLRAIRLLKEVDLILAEDTRVSIKLLKHFAIGTPLQSFHMHNEHKKVETVVEQLKNGKTVALISDAGTPGISDPGFLLVREALKEGVEVQCLPGPTALIPALVQSGIPCERFVFEGFLPPKKGRQTRLEQIRIGPIAFKPSVLAKANEVNRNFMF
jgi:16S rRNA (cytidine1402-2'-O)-methyltransferase